MNKDDEEEGCPLGQCKTCGKCEEGEEDEKEDE